MRLASVACRIGRIELLMTGLRPLHKSLLIFKAVAHDDQQTVKVSCMPQGVYPDVRVVPLKRFAEWPHTFSNSSGRLAHALPPKDRGRICSLTHVLYPHRDAPRQVRKTGPVASPHTHSRNTAQHHGYISTTPALDSQKGRQLQTHLAALNPVSDSSRTTKSQAASPAFSSPCVAHRQEMYRSTRQGPI